MPSVAFAGLRDLLCVARASCRSASVEVSAGLVYNEGIDNDCVVADCHRVGHYSCCRARWRHPEQLEASWAAASAVPSA